MLVVMMKYSSRLKMFITVLIAKMKFASYPIKAIFKHKQVESTNRKILFTIFK